MKEVQNLRGAKFVLAETKSLTVWLIFLLIMLEQTKLEGGNRSSLLPSPLEGGIGGG